jgi:hypothetical protein
MSEYGLLLAFDSDDPEFIRGFECGRIWSEIRSCEDIALGPYTMHASNAEMAIRIAEACGRIARSEEIDDTRIEVVFVVDPDAEAPA